MHVHARQMIIRMFTLVLLGCASRPPLPCATTVPVDVITVCVSDKYQHPYCWTGDVGEWKPRVIVSGELTP